MTGTWSAGGSLSTGREEAAGSGDYNATFITGGNSSSSNAITSTEEYNGTSWSSGGSLSTGRAYHGAAGTLSSGLAIAGGDPSFWTTETEEYDGTSWSSGGNLSTARHFPSAAGVQSSALAAGGYHVISGYLSSSEEYNGTSWSSGGSLSTAREKAGSAGNSNSDDLIFGGSSSSGVLSTSEEYNGTSWSSGGSLITARTELPLSPVGITNDAFVFGGEDSSSSILSSSEKYNGTSWSLDSSLNTAREYHGGMGDSSNALSVAGYDGTSHYLSSTEEYSSGPTYSWTGSLTHNHQVLIIAENNNYAYISFYQSAGESIRSTLKFNLSSSQIATPDSSLKFSSAFSLTENQSISSDLKYKIKTFLLSSNQSVISIILPLYNLLNRDIDNFHIIQSLDRPINYAECKLQGDINIDLFEPIKMQARSPVNNSMQIMFLGLITDYERSLNQEITIIQIKAKDHSFLLDNQYINESYANTSSSLNPSSYIKTMLGGDSWLSTTGIYPYNISDVPNWSQDHQFIWDPIRTTKLKAIQDIEKWCSMKFFLDYTNVSNVPRPRAYFVYATSTSEVLDHFSIDMNNDSTIAEIYKHQTVDEFKNTIKVFGYDQNLVKLTHSRLYTNRSFPLEKTYESVFLKNQSKVNEYTNTLYDAYIFSKEKYEAEGVLRPEIRPGTTITVNNLSGHSNETFTIYHVEHTFQNGLGNTKFKYAKIPNAAFIDSNKEKTIADIVQITAQKVIDENYLVPIIATVTSDEGGGLYTIRLENSSTEVKSVNVLSNVSIGDKVLYFKNNNVAIK